MSSGKALTFVDFARAAFGWRVKVPLLGHVPFNILALVGFGILGIGNPAFWLLGLAYETGYLLFLAGNERFQKVVVGRQLLEEMKIWEKKKQDLIALLDAPSRERYQHVAAISASIFEVPGRADSAADDLRSRNLSQLLWTFLQLLASRQRIRATLGQVSSRELEQEIAQTRSKMEGVNPESALHRSLQGSLDIAQRRYDNLLRATDNLKVVDAELDRIEKQFALLREEASVSSSPEAMTVRLDSVMQSLQDTSRWLSDHKELLGSTESPILPDIVHLKE